MKVLIDTCVWSKVLRAHSPDPLLSNGLRELIENNRVALIGPILQEILSGVKDKKEFTTLKDRFASFDHLPITQEVYVKAAEYYNLCKMHGVNGGHIDFLICAVVDHYGCALLTIDNDFEIFKKYLPVKLFTI